MPRGLPPGLTINPSTGVVSGVPVAQGAYTFNVRATDATGGVVRGEYSIQVFELDIDGGPTDPNTGQPTVDGGAPDGSVGYAYTYTGYAVSGGTAPYTWAITSGTLPDGITMDSATGALSGTPTTEQTANFTFTVTDSAGASRSMADAIQVVSVAALLHFGEADGATEFVDAVGTSWTIGTNAATRTTEARFGTGSLGRLVQSSSALISKQGLTTPGTGDFTVDFWLFLGEEPTTGGSRTLMNGFLGDLAFGGVSPADQIRYETSSGDAYSPGALVAGEWMHVAVERYQSVARVYINGIQGTSSADTSDYTADQINIYAPESGATSSHVDEFRYLPSTAAYQGQDFTPPRRAYQP